MARRDEENANRIGTTHKHLVHVKIMIVPPSKCSILERTHYHYFLMQKILSGSVDSIDGSVASSKYENMCPTLGGIVKSPRGIF